MIKTIGPEYLDAMRTLLAIPFLLVAVPATAQVYKCVQEDGTVVYTDQRCSDDAQPMDLPELTVMDAPKPKAFCTIAISVSE